MECDNPSCSSHINTRSGPITVDDIYDVCSFRCAEEITEPCPCRSGERFCDCCMNAAAKE